MNPTEGPCPDTSIRFDQVTRAFGSKHAVDDVTVDLPAGQTTSIIGPSGSGKSTLLRLINGLERPNSGRVVVGGQDITEPGFDITALRRGIGMVFQQYSLFPHLTVLQNVTFALREVHKTPKPEAIELARQALADVGIGHLEQRKPDFISGGERQRVAIARALAIHPQYVLFDEITSALDPELVKGVLELVADFKRRGLTIVVVTHEMRFAAKSSDFVVFMDHGRLVESGPPDAVFHNPQTDRLKDFLAALN